MTTTAPTAPTSAEPATPSRWSDLAAFGLLLIVLVAVAYFIAGAATGTGFGEGSLFLVIALVPLLTALAIRRSAAAWPNVLGVVVTLLLVLGGFWLAFGLSFLASPVEFTTALAYVLGVVLSFAGNVLALAHRRRSHAPTAGPRDLRRIVIVTAVALGVAAVISSGVALTTAASVAPAEAAGAVPVTMRGMAFTATEIVVPADEPARLLVDNADPFVHDIVIQELDVDAVLSPGDEVLVELTAPAGTYTVYCTLHADTSVTDPLDAGMATRLVATP